MLAAARLGKLPPTTNEIVIGVVGSTLANNGAANFGFLEGASACALDDDSACPSEALPLEARMAVPVGLGRAVPVELPELGESRPVCRIA